MEGEKNMQIETEKLEVVRKELIRTLTKRQKELKELVKQKSADAETAPKGSLRVQQKKGSTEYYWRQGDDHKNGIYIKGNDIRIAKELAQRDYNTKVIRIMSHELKLMEVYLDYIKKHGLEEQYADLVKGRKVLLDPIAKSDDDYRLEWESVTWESMHVEGEPSEFVTENGICVRSKSELIIANMLERYKVPYRYEYPIILEKPRPVSASTNMLKTVKVRPDFLCLNMRTREEIIWEHFGMMDDSEYSDRTIEKINTYEQSGYVSGWNFIMTFESAEHPLSSNLVKMKILNHLL